MANTRHTVRHIPSKAFIALHIAVVLIPFATLAVWSVAASWPAPDLLPHAYSAKGFAEVFRPSQHTGQALITSIGIACACAVVSTFAATLAAWAITQYRFVGRRLFRFAAILPFLIPTTVFAMGVQVAFIKLGLARSAFGVMLAHCIVALPYALVIMTDVCKAVGTKLSEAAQTLGANPLQRTFHVVLPLLTPGILSSLSMTYILSFSQYFLTLLIGGGAVHTFVLDMFPYLAGGDRTVSSAYAVVFFLVVLGVFALFNGVLKRFYGKADQAYFAS